MIVILDAGSQYLKLIDRIIRSFCVESVVVTPEVLDELLNSKAHIKGIIISGSPNSVISNKLDLNEKIFEMGIPILGICYGMQYLASLNNGTLVNDIHRDDGQFKVMVDNTSMLYNGLENCQKVLLTHGDSVVDIPNFNITSKLNKTIISFENPDKKIYAVQFHPEVDLTENGKKMLENFIFKICNCDTEFNVRSRLDELIQQVGSKVLNKKVLVLVSGGVDSAVCAALMNNILPQNQIKAIHVDTGFMRENESNMVVTALTNIGVNVQVINAKDEFFKQLHGIVDPEKKRNIIGDLFIDLVKPFIDQDTFLVQGTLRPDLIESASLLASAKASVIKTHHNDTKSVRKLRDLGVVIEPLKDFHKDEVRELGKLLGLPEAIVNRPPFPGPGLAIRLLCATEPFRENYEKIVNNLKEYNFPKNIKPILLPIRSVGIQGDERSYKYVCALTDEGHIEDVNFTELIELAKQLTRTNKEINRVVYTLGFFDEFDLKVNFIPTLINDDTVGLLRKADNICNKICNEYNCKTSQMPVILIPVGFGESRKRSIVIRTIITNDFMTGTVAEIGKNIPYACVDKMLLELKDLSSISAVFYDLTGKPPGTTEWE